MVAVEAESSLILALDLIELNADTAAAFHLLFTDEAQLPFYTFDKDFFRKASRSGYEIQLVP
ncbi:type II toxin-antitoxin system VapC family toxin [bacterium]|nr:type II toxin-antitoxin system VapC family toxin [bacterium]